MKDNELNFDKILDNYYKYWDLAEMDIDLANELIDSIPELVRLALLNCPKKEIK
jgi:hypothetical protein